MRNGTSESLGQDANPDGRVGVVTFSIPRRAGWLGYHRRCSLASSSSISLSSLCHEKRTKSTEETLKKALNIMLLSLKNSMTLDPTLVKKIVA